MLKFELEYAAMIEHVKRYGSKEEGRNGYTLRTVGHQLKVPLYDTVFPLLCGRRIFFNGVLGELAAMLRGPKHVNDFKEQGCNFWGLWSDDEGNLELDYGNAWRDFNGVDQIAQLKEDLANNRSSRRMVINAWRPDRLDKLSLPCCHYAYQFVVINDTLHMVWIQRSADLMIGVPSDIVFGAVWLLAVANEFGLQPGTLTMQFGDVHIYEEHLPVVDKYLDAVYTLRDFGGSSYPTAHINAPAGADFTKFEPGWLTISNYNYAQTLKFELKE